VLNGFLWLNSSSAVIVASKWGLFARTVMYFVLGGVGARIRTGWAISVFKVHAAPECSAQMRLPNYTDTQRVLVHCAAVRGVALQFVSSFKRLALTNTSVRPCCVLQTCRMARQQSDRAKLISYRQASELWAYTQHRYSAMLAARKCTGRAHGVRALNCCAKQADVMIYYYISEKHTSMDTAVVLPVIVRLARPSLSVQTVPHGFPSQIRKARGGLLELCLRTAGVCLQ
jgi:hypothetical protein